MFALRAPVVFDGSSFLDAGGTVLVEGGTIVGVESFGHELPHDCPVTTYAGTILPGLVDMHTHLVTDSGPMALERVAACTEREADEVVTEALRRQLAAGVTTVRDLGDRRFCVVGRRDRQATTAREPRIVASGPPITTPGGHCHFLGGETDGATGMRDAVRERAERGVDVVKVMASGGVNTPGSDMLRTQFTDVALRTAVDEAHSLGLPVTAHAHGTPAVRQALDAGVDGIEHCTCVSERGFGDCDDALVGRLAASGVAVCPTLGADWHRFPVPPPPLQALAASLGTTVEGLAHARNAFVARLHASGVRIVSGVDSGIQPAKGHGTLPFAIEDLVEGGVAVADALATATSLAAEACGLGRTTGRLVAGADADLLVVEADVAADVTTLRRPLAVLISQKSPIATAGPRDSTNSPTTWVTCPVHRNRGIRSTSARYGAREIGCIMAAFATSPPDRVRSLPIAIRPRRPGCRGRSRTPRRPGPASRPGGLQQSYFEWETRAAGLPNRRLATGAPARGRLPALAAFRAPRAPARAAPPGLPPIHGG